MASYLPAGIVNIKEYFNIALHLLVRYEWLYNFPMTEILSSGLLDQLPYEWWPVLQNLTVDELNGIPKGEYKDSWPVSLKEFIATAMRLRLPIADQPVPPGAPIPERLRHALVRGMSPKKLHEVLRLAAVVVDFCARSSIDCIVDMGCGLGYLCEIMHFMFGFRVVGLESDPAKVARAKERHANTCRLLRVEDEGGVRYVECDVTDNTEPVMRALSQVLDDNGQPAPFCLVGLHSCGDLTPYAVHMFHSIDQITHFMLVTCCYHKMEVDAGGTATCLAAAEQAEPPKQTKQQGQRVEEREGKARLALQWLQQWGRVEAGAAGASPLQEMYLPKDSQDPQDPNDPQALEQDSNEAQDPPAPQELPDVRDMYRDDTHRAVLNSLLVKWFAPSGTILAPRKAPAPDHFFRFPLSQDLRGLAQCGAKRLKPSTIRFVTRRRSASAGKALTRSICKACPKLAGCCAGSCAPRTRKGCALRTRSCSESGTPEPERAERGAPNEVLTDCARGIVDCPRSPVDCPGDTVDFARGPVDCLRSLLGRCGRGDASADGTWFGSEGLSGCQFLRRPFLRLASNETVVSWECRSGPTHTSNSIHMMTRAVFQLYATANNLTLAQRGACLLHNMQLGMGSRTILADIVDRLLPSLSEEERRVHKKSLAFLYAALDPLRPLLEAVVGLQVALQHVCEGLVLVDRVAALAQDVPNVGIIRVADPYFSPRCFALVAEKGARAPRRP